MKTLEKMLIKTLALRNWSTLEIVANIFVFCVSLYYFGINALIPILAVTGFFIVWSGYSLSQSIKHKTFSFHPGLIEQRFSEYIVAFGFMMFCIIRSLVFIKVALAVQTFSQFGGEAVAVGLNEHIGQILFIGILATLFIAYGIKNQSEKLGEFSFDVQIDHLKSKYNLNADNTYYFIINNKVVAFLVGKYTFDIMDGLIIGEHKYKLSAVVEYLEMADIGFDDLNDGHVKNIEMYGI